MVERIADSFRRRLEGQNLEEASGLLAEAASAMGWDLAAFHSDALASALPRASSGKFIAQLMGWPDDYVAGWVEQKLGRDCPVGERCLRVAVPFSWSSDASTSCWQRHRLPADKKRTLGYYHKHVVGALTVPVHREGLKVGYVSWFSRTESSLRERSAAQQDTAYMVSHLFIHHLDNLGDSLPCPSQSLVALAEQLTSRETECLTWAARGKTEEEVSMIIGRSQATARFHLRNAMRKLNASNRTHAVAKACTLGLISVNH